MTHDNTTIRNVKNTPQKGNHLGKGRLKRKLRDLVRENIYRVAFHDFVKKLWQTERLAYNFKRCFLNQRCAEQHLLIFNLFVDYLPDCLKISNYDYAKTFGLIMICRLGDTKTIWFWSPCARLLRSTSKETSTLKGDHL